jgi:NTE family protein
MEDSSATAVEPERIDSSPARQPRRRTEVTVKTINLALQGGGAHGAFAWGVLDRLLEDERIAFEGISATSAGAMNATVVAYGLTEGGREGARRALVNFWRRVSHGALLSPLQPTWWDRISHDHSMRSNPAFMVFDLMTRLFSPYQFNPSNFHPLRGILEESVDFDRLRQKCAIKLYLCATNVRTGKVKIFESHEIGVDAVLASGCLPFMFQAIEIDGEAYWDGGYMGNPALFPLIYGCDSRDVVVVHINPIERPDIPKDARDILNRVNEISFNSSLMREMRAVAFVSKLIDDGKITDGSLKRMLVHAIDGGDFMRDLGVSSKLNPDWEFLTHLHDVGWERADAWVKENFATLGRDSTIDLRVKYL